MSVETLLKEALDRLDSCINFLAETAMDRDTAIKKVSEIPFDNLPQHVDDDNDLEKEMVLARLRKEDLRCNSNFVLQSLWDTEFSIDDYKSIGENDGELHVLSMIFKELGDEANSKKCYEWIYSND
jgi:hypothetical protein